MTKLWLQIKSISKATAALEPLRRSLSGFGILATEQSVGFYDCLSFSIENVSGCNNLSGLPKTADHQQLKI